MCIAVSTGLVDAIVDTGTGWELQVNYNAPLIGLVLLRDDAHLANLP